MKMELKVFILSLLMSFMFMGIFTYFINGLQKDYYVLQVGIYSKQENKDEKVDELTQLGIKAEYYSKDDYYYVFSFLSDDLKEVEKYQKEYNIDGIIKCYPAYVQEDSESFLQHLKEGEVQLIKTLPKEENPREKALAYGVESLNNVELLALILRTGNKRENVLELAQRLLLEIGGMEHLTELNYAFLTSIKGIKDAKAIELLSVLELAKRVSRFSYKKVLMNDPNNIYYYMKNKMMFLNQEHFVVLCLDTKCQLIKEKTLFIGTTNMSLVTAKEIFKEAIQVNSTFIILCHNHPSGDSSPSNADIDLTQNVKKLGDMMGIKVLDHIIIGKNEFYSLEIGYKIIDKEN